MREKKLSVLMDRYVEHIAGAGYEIVSLNAQSHLLVEKRYAAAIVAKGTTKLAGREAYVAVLEVANIDQIKIDPNARRERVEVVLLHTDFTYEKRSLNESAKPASFPVVMFAGYANMPDEFEAGLGEFHDFLGRIEIAGERGFNPPELGGDQAKRQSPKEQGQTATSEDAEPEREETAPSSEPASETTESPSESAP